MICFPRLGDYGRLGNAMFQYSALLGIANKTKFEAMYAQIGGIENVIKEVRELVESRLHRKTKPNFTNLTRSN